MFPFPICKICVHHLANPHLFSDFYLLFFFFFFFFVKTANLCTYQFEERAHHLQNKKINKILTRRFAIIFSTSTDCLSGQGKVCKSFFFFKFHFKKSILFSKLSPQCPKKGEKYNLRENGCIKMKNQKKNVFFFLFLFGFEK